MKLAREDFRRLRLSMAVAAVLAALGAAAIVAAEAQLSQEKKLGEAAMTERKAAEERVSKVSVEEREIRENLVHYQKLVERGMIGPERRLDLIDAITRIKTARRLYEIRYQIDAQGPLDYPGVNAKGSNAFMVSRMNLNMQLLHEEDLVNFLADLNAVGKSYVSVRSCSVTRNPPGQPSRTLTPRLRAACVVDLITLRETKAV